MLRTIAMDKISEWKSKTPVIVLHENTEGIAVVFAKVEGEYEVDVILPRGSLYKITRGPSKKEINRRYKIIVKRLEAGAFITITGVAEAKISDTNPLSKE